MQQLFPEKNVTNFIALKLVDVKLV